MTKQVDDLIRELLSLYIRYGARNFEAALSELKSGHITDRIFDVSSELRKVAKMRGTRTKLTAAARETRANISMRERLESYADRLKTSGDERAAHVAIFALDISGRRALITPRNLRDYMLMLGMPITEKKLDRHDAARKIAEHLMEIPASDTAAKISIGRDMNPASSTLQGWSNIIVKRHDNG